MIPIAALMLLISSGCVAGGPLDSPSAPADTATASAQPAIPAGSLSPTSSPSTLPARSAAPLRSDTISAKVSGSLLAGPTCPVETNPPNPACAPRPVAGAAILALDQAGGTVARAVSTADGFYQLVLAAGRYELAPQAVAGQSMRVPAPKSVTVGPDTVSLVVDFSYDTGIR